MTKLFEWIYQNDKQSWNIYCNGITSRNIKSKEQAIELGRKLAQITVQERSCIVDILVQDSEGAIERIETFTQKAPQRAFIVLHNSK